MYDYYKPDMLPEFDSFKSSTISTELEYLLRRIILVIPADLKPRADVEELIDSYLADSVSNQRIDQLGEGFYQRLVLKRVNYGELMFL